jgi:hypothetical protein
MECRRQPQEGFGDERVQNPAAGFWRTPGPTWFRQGDFLRVDGLQDIGEFYEGFWNGTCFVFEVGEKSSLNLVQTV